MLETIKSLIFFSNYFNHHQKALCDAWYQLLGDGFTFVETMPMEEFRANMGWGEELPSYVLRAHESAKAREQAQELSMSCDLVLMGTAPEYYIEPRLDAGKLIFRYSERPLKEGFVKFLIPRLCRKYLHMHVRNKKKNIHVLAASAFASYDYKKMFGSYPDKCYKFGYFPEHIPYDIDALVAEKEEAAKKGGAPLILWEGRMLKLKRADLLIKAAGILRDRGYDFRIRVVGDGPERENLLKLTNKLGLMDRICFEGFLSPQEAREAMKQASVYVATSNFLEGWGSVIYEGLNAGCAVIASHACGATPYLIKDGETGLVFQSGSKESLANQIECCLKDSETRKRLGKNAYEQMASVWNPTVAAKRVLKLAEAINEKKECPFEDGPCSRAEYIKNNWYE